MHHKSIMHIDPERNLSITFHLIDIHPFQLFNENSEGKEIKDMLTIQS